MGRRITYLLAGAALLLGPAATAANPVRYQVKFSPSGDKTLDYLLAKSASLVSLQKKLPPAPFALISRAQADATQFRIVLHSLGYDSGRVSITIDGDALRDPALLGQLTQAPKGQIAQVLVTPHPGPLFHIGTLTMPGAPAGFTAPATVHPGEAARAAPILAARGRLQTALQNAGYAFAEVGPPLALAHLGTARLDVSYPITPGPRVRIGRIRFSGLKYARADFLRRHIALRPGQKFSDDALTRARDSLIGLGVFSSVTPQAQDRPTSNGQVPIIFHVIEQKRHAVTLTGSYATDLGVTLLTSWEDRDLTGRADTLTFSAAANGLGGTGSVAPGYDLKSVFGKPDFVARGQTLDVSLEALNQSLPAYSRTALLAGVALTRPFGPHLALSYGPSVEAERVLQEGVSRNYLLLQFPMSLDFDTANSVLEPTRGINASITLTPTEPMVGDHSPFLIAQASAATYLAVEPAARGVVAVRVQIGSIQGASQFGVPPDQRFYAGGAGTVRGYTYQTIGPLFPNRTPEGGLAFDVANLEFRQHVWGHFGVAPFVDAGQVSATSAPFTGTLRVGVGLGVLYYTGIGPIRVDIAFPTTHAPGSGGFALYVGLGEAF